MSLKELLIKMDTTPLILSNPAFNLIERDLKIPQEFFEQVSEDKIIKTVRFSQIKTIKMTVIPSNNCNVKYEFDLSVVGGKFINLYKKKEMISTEALNQPTAMIQVISIFMNKENQLVCRQYFKNIPSMKREIVGIEKLYQNGLQMEETQVKGKFLRVDLSPLENFNQNYDAGWISEFKHLKREQIGYITYAKCIEYPEDSLQVKTAEGYVNLDLNNLSELKGECQSSINFSYLEKVKTSKIRRMSETERQYVLEKTPNEVKNILEQLMKNEFSFKYLEPISITYSSTNKATKRIKPLH